MLHQKTTQFKLNAYYYIFSSQYCIAAGYIIEAFLPLNTLWRWLRLVTSFLYSASRLCIMNVLNVHLSQRIPGDAIIGWRNKTFGRDIVVHVPEDLPDERDGSLLVLLSLLLQRPRVFHRVADTIQGQQNRNQINSW